MRTPQERSRTQCEHLKSVRVRNANTSRVFVHAMRTPQECSRTQRKRLKSIRAYLERLSMVCLEWRNGRDEAQGRWTVLVRPLAHMLSTNISFRL